MGISPSADNVVLNFYHHHVNLTSPMHVRHDKIRVVSTAICLLFLSAFAAFAQNRNRIDLSGDWRFALDRAGEGQSANWFNRALPDRIK